MMQVAMAADGMMRVLVNWALVTSVHRNPKEPHLVNVFYVGGKHSVLLHDSLPQPIREGLDAEIPGEARDAADRRV